ncbi:MAG: hypothetical protein WA918_12865 [Erythrobacter sp.]
MSLVLALAGWLGASVAALAQGDVPDRDGVAATATYADLVTLAERSDMVIRARIRDQIPLPPERAPGLAPGFARLYIEAETTALITGTTPVGEELTYLVDVPLRENGKAPRIAGLEMLLFARPVAGRRGAIQLTGQPAQFPYSEALETRLRPILTELVGGNPPPRITGIGNALAVPGTLAGESETQIFLTTDTGSPVSLTVLRRPAQPPVWGVSWGEIVDSAAKPPAPESLRWYRLACALPEELPADVNLARDPEARRLAERDYALVREQLGACRRSLTQG